MTNIEKLTRELGEEIQKDERYLAFIAARNANDNDEELQNKIGEFNLAKASLDRAVSGEERDDAKINELNDRLGEIYREIMANELMLKYNEARGAMDGLMSEINGILTLCANGDDPKTCKPQTGCGGNCASCGGCH